MSGKVSLCVVIRGHSGAKLALNSAALNPANLLGILKGGGPTYQSLALFSVALGMLFMLVVILSVFLTDVPIAGFVAAGLVMAVILSYGHFIWFHLIGRFAAESMGVEAPTPTEA